MPSDELPCPHCGEETPFDREYCVNCDWAVPFQRDSMGTPSVTEVLLAALTSICCLLLFAFSIATPIFYYLGYDFAARVGFLGVLLSLGTGTAASLTAYRFGSSDLNTDGDSDTDSEDTT